jgi:tripartite-type tricarboxylate transporter receptor subunit TctC
MIKKLSVAFCLAAATAVVSAPVLAADGPLRGNVRMVTGSSSTGGDTYQNSAIIADALSKALDMNIKVDAVGVSEAFKALERDSRGNTIMMFHDQADLGNLYGVNGYEDPFETYIIGPTVAINPGNAYLVPKDSPYQTIEDIIQAAANDTRVRVAIQPGGVSEIGYSALKNAVRLRYPGKEGNIAAVNTGSQADKNQLLFDAQADLINASVQSEEQFTRLPAEDQKAMRFVWLTARHETIEQASPEGLGDLSREDLLQYVVPNVTVEMEGGENFTFDKEFFLLYNKETDPEIIQQIDETLAEIYAEGEIQKKSFFIPNFMPSAEAQAHLQAKRDEYEGIINALSAPTN